MGYIHFLPSILNAIIDIASYYCVILKIVIVHDGIKTIQNVCFFIVFTEKTKSCFVLKKQVSVKKQENPVGCVFL